jgi:hypothetical protein
VGVLGEKMQAPRIAAVQTAATALGFGRIPGGIPQL